MRQEFYINDKHLLHYVTEVESSPPTVETEDTPSPAVALLQRSRAIAKILLGDITGANVNALEEFPISKILQPR